MPRSGEHTLYYSDKFCSANPKDIVHTTLTNSAVPIPRTLCILLWQILHCQFQGHCAYYSDKFCSANPKDIVHTTLTDPPVPIPRTYCILLLHPKDTVLTQILQCQSQRTLCIRLWQILQCQSQGHCAYANSPVPIPRTLCAHCSDKLWCQSQGLCAH